MKARVGLRFFGRDAPVQLTARLWSLRELLRQAADKQIDEDERETFARIASAVERAYPEASPKARESLDMMTKAVKDIQRICSVPATQSR